MYVLIDPGHGGMINNVYQTAGKRSPKWADLPQLFEGVQNRKIANKLKELLKAANIPFMDVVDSESDVSLGERVRKANAAYKQHPDAVYISIHADAAGDGVNDHPAKGFSVWTSKGETKSDLLAEAILLELAASMAGRSTFRSEKSDGDSDYESDFFVLHKTNCPAVLCELGFMTNRKECEQMQKPEWIDQAAKGIYNGIIKFYTK